MTPRADLAPAVSNGRPTPGARASRWLHGGRVPGLRARPAPNLALALVGVGLGRLLPAFVLGALEIAVWVALGLLGVLLALDLRMPPKRDAARVAATAAVSALAAGVLVALAQVLLFRAWSLPLPVDPRAAAALVGACAALPAWLPITGAASDEDRRAARFVDLHALALTAGAVVVIAVLAGGEAASRLLASIGLGAAVGLAAWLLLTAGTAPGERAVFLAGSVLLVAGVGEFLQTSPLLAGFAAGAVWRRAPRAHVTHDDFRSFHHPLVALLLIVVGASVRWNLAALWIASSAALLGLGVKVLLGLGLARLVAAPAPTLATLLLQPGVLAVGLVMNALSTLGGGYGDVASGLAIAWMVGSVLAAFLPPHPGVEE